MKKVAVFGNTGGGKSTLSQQLSQIVDVPLYVLDKVQFKPGGIAVSEQAYQQAHAAILELDQWVIDGFGSMETLWPRLDAADCLVYVDLPILRHGWWVTKRMAKGFWVTPEGWPERSSILKSSIISYQTLWRCHRYLTPRYRQYVEQAKLSKQVYHLRSKQQISHFINSLK